MNLCRCLVLVLLLLALGCATDTGGVSPKRVFNESSWWGQDPVCSPGCPAGMPGRW